MDTGGWVLAADFASKLGITTDELIIRARHYPSECIEFSVWNLRIPLLPICMQFVHPLDTSTRGSELTGWEYQSA